MQWKYIEEISEELIEKKSKEWKVSKFLATLLLQKKFNDKNLVKKFLHPSINDFENPFDFENMNKAVKKIVEIKKRKEKLFIYGDYDVDGISAAVFLTLAFRSISIDVDYYIPNRMDEGYGLDEANINFINSNKGKLIITVDTGVNSYQDVEYAKNLGIDVIVTDHHKSVADGSEDNTILINPKLSSTYPFKFLSGAGVALKLAQAVFIALDEDFSKLYQFIDIAMIGTVADVVPMFHENRIIISKGLKNLKKTKVKGLIYLMKYLKLYNRDLTTTDVSYFICPLINSLGRLGNSKLGADFFMETDDFAIYNIIEEMKKSNKKRRAMENIILTEAISIIESKDLKSLKYIFISSEKWHPGIIGVIASKLSIKYDLPVAMISINNGIAKASCRSIPGINIFNILKLVEHKLIRFGGHDLAAGFMAHEKDLPYIESYFKRNIKTHENEVKQPRFLTVNLNLPIEKVDNLVFSDIQNLAPFGLENTHPIFFDKDISITDTTFFGIENRHFSGNLVKCGISYPFLGFDLSFKFLKNKSNTYYEILYYPEEIMIKGKKSYQFRLKDLKAQNA